MGFSVGEATYRLRWIAPGVYWVGSPESDKESFVDERPRHQIRLTEGYWIGETPVTQALWTEVMGDNPSYFKGDGQRPVEQVNWNTCEAFCERLNERIDGLEAELPTEVQWEVACRAGEELSPRYGELEAIAWFGGNSGEQTHRVGEKSPNHWGLYDMLGNVWEWCRDDMRTYGEELHRNPIGSTIGSSSRVIRGGSFYARARECRAAFRGSLLRGHGWIEPGFRLCRGQPTDKGVQNGYARAACRSRVRPDLLSRSQDFRCTRGQDPAGLEASFTRRPDARFWCSRTQDGRAILHIPSLSDAEEEQLWALTKKYDFPDGIRQSFPKDAFPSWFGFGDDWIVVTTDGVRRGKAVAFGAYSGASAFDLVVVLDVSAEGLAARGDAWPSALPDLREATSLDLRLDDERLNGLRGGLLEVASPAASRQLQAQPKKSVAKVVEGNFPGGYTQLVTIGPARDTEDGAVAGLVLADAAGRVKPVFAPELTIDRFEIPYVIIDIDGNGNAGAIIYLSYYEGSYIHLLDWTGGGEPRARELSGDGA